MTRTKTAQARETLSKAAPDKAIPCGATSTKAPQLPALEGVSEAFAAPTLRDLAWLLHAPDLVHLPGFPGRPSNATLGLGSSAAKAGWLLHHAAWLNGPAWETRRRARMGQYHEKLWHYLLDHAPDTRLLARSVTVFKRRNTAGELDMVYRTRGDPAPVHLEVAIKFYLGLDAGPGASDSQNRWIGPSGIDSLARKSHHMATRQLRFSATDAARETLRHWLTPRDTGEHPRPLRARYAMPGVLFYPFHAALPPPAGSTAGHIRGVWCYARDWPALAEGFEADARGAWLPKPGWLAPPPLERFVPLAEAAATALERLRNPPVPQQLMVYLPRRASAERVFIVPDDWPRQIPLPLTD